MIKFAWRWSLILTVPTTCIGVYLLSKMLVLYSETALRQIGDRGLKPFTLEQAGYLEFDALKRRFSPVYTVESTFEHLDIYVKQEKRNSLDRALPSSGTEYVKARLQQGNEKWNIKLKYRGDYHQHWAFNKKSLRIKTKKKKLYEDMRHFNLIVPKTAALINNYMSYKIAGELNLLHPKFKFVTVSINGDYQGLYLLAEQVKEGFLRRQRRLPGDIYSGDQVYYDIDRWTGVNNQLFEQAGLWDKNAANNKYPEASDKPLRALIEALSQLEKHGNFQPLREIINIDAFARFSVLETLLSTGHHDEVHNWKLYFDPARGKFEPIVWDSVGWSDAYLSGGRTSLWPDADTPPGIIRVSKVMQLLASQPEFISSRENILENFYRQGSDKKILAVMRDLFARLAPLVPIDSLAIDQTYNRITPEKFKRQFEKVEQAMQIIFTANKTLPGSKTGVNVIPPVEWQGQLHFTNSQMFNYPIRIGEGATLSLDADVHLTFKAKLLIDGSEHLPVTIKPAGAAHWGTIVIEGQAANGSVLNNVNISGGSGKSDGFTVTSGMLTIRGVADLSLRNCDLSSNTEGDDLLHVVYSSINIEQCQFHHAFMDAVDIDISKASISQSTFSMNGNDGLDLMDSIVTVKDSVFENNEDKGVSVGENSRLNLTDNKFHWNAIGVEAKDGALVEMQDNFLSNNGVGLNAYKKNWRYGKGGKILQGSIVLSHNQLDRQTDEHSEIR